MSDIAMPGAGGPVVSGGFGAIMMVCLAGKGYEVAVSGSKSEFSAALAEARQMYDNLDPVMQAMFGEAVDAALSACDECLEEASTAAEGYS